MLKVTSGKYKSLVLAQPPDSITRPISQKVRSAIFDSLGEITMNSSLLDLYSGSGAMAIEAMSRGGRKAVLVDNNPRAVSAIRRNIDKLESGIELVVINRDVGKFIKDCEEKFDIIILDPPYNKFDITVVNRVANLLQYGGIIVVSHSSKIPLSGLDENLQIVSSKHYGDTQIEYVNVLS